MQVSVEGRRRGEGRRATRRCRSPRARCAPRSRTISSAPIRPDRAAASAEARRRRRAKARFERISWDEALDEIAARFKAIAAEDPQTILPLQLRRHHGHGAVQLDGPALLPQARRLAARAHAVLLGRQGRHQGDARRPVGMDPERFDEAKLILIWGSNPIVSNLHLWSRVQEAKRRGAKVIAIDPYRSLTAEKCDAARRAPARHRRGARARHDARDHRRGPDRRRLRRAPYARLRAAARARRRTIRRRRSRRSAASRAEEMVQLARDYARDAAGGDPAQLRHAAALPAAAWRCAPSPACRRSPAPGAMRPAASCSPPATSTASTTRRSSAPT